MQDISGETEALEPAEGKQIAKAESKVSRPAISESIHHSRVPAAVGSEEDMAQTLQRYVRMFIKQRWIIIGITLCFASIGALHALMTTRLYTATTKIQIDFEANKVVEGDTTADSKNSAGSDFQRTHYELLKSRAITKRVVSALQLQEDLDFLSQRDQWLISRFVNLFRFSSDFSSIAPTARAEIAAGIVSQHIEVKPVIGSRLINLIYTDPDRQRAQRIANAYADAYIAANLDKRFQANAYAKIFLEDQIKQLKLRLEGSETALLEFATKEKIVQSPDKTSIAETNLAAANATLGLLISERIKAEQAWRQVETVSEIGLPQILSNVAIEGLRARRKTLQQEYQDKLTIFKPKYPVMIELSNQIKEIDKQLEAEVATIKTSLENAYRSTLGQENAMRERIEELRNEVLDVQKKNFKQDIFTREVATNRALYNSLLQRYKEVDVASGVGTNNIFVIDRAPAPSAPSHPKVIQILIISFALGLGTGLVVAYVLEIFDDYIREPEEIEQSFGVSALGVIPLVESEEALANASKDPRSPISEAYRSLATALQFSTSSGVPRSILVTSSGPREGKSTTALAIARHFATMGSKVLLIDADLRRPSLHTQLGKDNARGLSNYLSGATLTSDLVQQTDLRTLKFIGSGPEPPNAGDLLGGSRIHSLISIGLEIFDLVIVDAPPLLGLADALLLSNATGATIFIASAGQSRKRVVLSAIRRLALAHTRPIGMVLTKFDGTAMGYGYGYGYGYEGYYYGGSIDVVDGDTSKPKIVAVDAS